MRFFDEAVGAANSGDDATDEHDGVPVLTQHDLHAGTKAKTQGGGSGSVDAEPAMLEGKERPSDHHPRPAIPVPYLRMTRLALRLASGTPAFTNFTPEFTETLDWVFIDGGGVEEGGRNSGSSAAIGGACGSSRNGGDRSRQTEGTCDVLVLGRGSDSGGRDGGTGHVAPMPEEGPLRALTPGLPSETYPSDHVSLVVDLELLMSR